MLRLIWAASIRTHTILSYAPTNLLIAATRTRRGLKWGTSVMLLAVPYLIAAEALRDLIDGGGHGWLNLVVVVCIWNAMKLALMGPASVLLLLRARMGEHVTQRHASRCSPVVADRDRSGHSRRPVEQTLDSGCSER